MGPPGGIVQRDVFGESEEEYARRLEFLVVGVVPDRHLREPHLREVCRWCGVVSSGVVLARWVHMPQVPSVPLAFRECLPLEAHIKRPDRIGWAREIYNMELAVDVPGEGESAGWPPSLLDSLQLT